MVNNYSGVSVAILLCIFSASVVLILVLRYSLSLSLFQDSTFEFERKRNVPVKYNRQLWQQTGRKPFHWARIFIHLT